MLISPAWAQGAGGGGLGGIEGLLPLVLIFVVFYFLLIRPQQKKAKQHREMIAALRRGDRIVTNGGLIGSITRVVNDNELILEVAEGVKVRVMRSMIAESLSKSEPAPAKGKKKREEEQAEEEEYEEEDYDEEYEDEPEDAAAEEEEKRS